MEVLTERKIADEFFDEHLMVLKSKSKDDEPWYADFVNYIVGKEEPYAFKLRTDIIMRRCVAGSETLEILAHCHSGPTGGHHSANVTAKKVYESRFYWPNVFKDANEAIKRILERSVGYNPKRWSEKLNDALWAFRTAYKTPMGCTPFRLLNELAELRDGAYENTRIYKERTKKWHDSRLCGDKDFKDAYGVYLGLDMVVLDYLSCAGDVVDFRTWPGISLETAMISTMDLDGRTYYLIWEVIQRGNGPVSVSIDTNDVIKVLPPKTIEEILARERERKARTTLLMALPEDHLAKFYKMTDAKRCRKLSNLDLVAMMNQRRCRSFGVILSQREIQVRRLTDDGKSGSSLVFESDVKGSTTSSSSNQNVAFVFENTSSTNEVSTGYGVSNSSGHNSQNEHPSSYSFLANQSTKDNGTRPGTQEETKALVTLDGDGVDWTSHSEDEQDNHAFMAYSSSSSDTEIDLDDKTDVLTYHKKLLAEAEKEKEELKAKIVYGSTSKNLNILLKSQMSARDKAGLRSSDTEDSPMNNRYADGMHEVPPPITGIYIPSGLDTEIDDSQFTYGLKQSKPSESDARSSDFIFASCTTLHS
ncbi:ribonuclease H-like domain-containing protein [Tanacetum coccineum]